MRFLITFLFLFISTFSFGEQVTSPFVYEIVKSESDNFVYKNSYVPNRDFDSFSSACSATLSVLSSRFANEVHLNDEKKGCEANSKIKETGIISLMHTPSITKETKPLDKCKSGESKTFNFNPPPSGTSACDNGCVINRSSSELTLCIGFSSSDTPKFCSFKATTTNKNCKLKPFDKSNQPPVNSPPPQSDRDKCPSNQRYSDHFKACVDFQCSANTKYDSVKKKCVSTNNSSNQQDSDATPVPDSSKPNNEKCPKSYKYNSATNQCLKSDSADSGSGDSGSGDSGSGDSGSGDSNNNTGCQYNSSLANGVCDLVNANTDPDCKGHSSQTCGSSNNTDGNSSNSCTQQQKDANNGQCPKGSTCDPDVQTCVKSDPKDEDKTDKDENTCTQEQKDKNDGKCPDSKEKITCDNFKMFCDFQEKFDDAVKSVEEFFDNPEASLKEEDDFSEHKITGDAYNQFNNFKIDKTRVQFQGTCPSDKSFNYMGNSYSINYSIICSSFEKLSSILLFLAYVSGALIVLRK